MIRSSVCTHYLRLAKCPYAGYSPQASEVVVYNHNFFAGRCCLVMFAVTNIAKPLVEPLQDYRRQIAHVFAAVLLGKQLYIDKALATLCRVSQQPAYIILVRSEIATPFSTNSTEPGSLGCFLSSHIRHSALIFAASPAPEDEYIYRLPLATVAPLAFVSVIVMRNIFSKQISAFADVPLLTCFDLVVKSDRRSSRVFLMV